MALLARLDLEANLKVLLRRSPDIPREDLHHGWISSKFRSDNGKFTPIISSSWIALVKKQTHRYSLGHEGGLADPNHPDQQFELTERSALTPLLTLTEEPPMTLPHRLASAEVHEIGYAKLRPTIQAGSRRVRRQVTDNTIGWAGVSPSSGNPSICPICGGSTHRELPAHLAPFIAERTGLSGPATTHFCGHCEHVYLTPFYSRDDIAHIYKGYRDDAYNAQREAHEPGYLQMAPGLSDPESQGHQVRRDFYNFFLPEWRDFQGTVIDYGGGDGYFSRYVFRDAEIVVVDEDFERQGGDIDKLLSRADFLFATHVFEHLSRPVQALSRLAARLRTKVPVYIELPKCYSGRLESAFADLERGQEQGSPIPWVDLAILHEHLAHFSKRSAQTMMSLASVPCSEFYYSGQFLGFLGQKG